MTNQSNSMLKSSMNYGLLLGAALIAISVITYMLDVLKPPFWVSLINYAVYIGIIMYGIFQYRNEVLGGSITYGKAVGLGVLISLFGGILSSLYLLIQVTIIDPDLIQKVLELTEETLLESGFNEDLIETQISMTAKMMTPTFMVISAILGTVFSGTLVSLIVSIFLKKDKPQFEA